MWFDKEHGAPRYAVQGPLIPPGQYPGYSQRTHRPRLLTVFGVPGEREMLLK